MRISDLCPASATSSAASSPLSDTSTAARSWPSILAPKRSLDGDIGDRRSETSQEKPTDGHQAPKKKLKRKYRKGTHTLRKEEKERLLKEMAILQREMEALKKRAIDPSFRVDQLVRKSQRQTLQEGLQKHQEKFCKALSIMSDYTLCNVQAGTPLQQPIVLGKDTASRIAALQAMKDRKLRNAERFLQARRSQLDPCKALTEDQRYETETGNFTSAHFSITQFEGVRSVKQIFDLVIFYFHNMEISVSEKLDSLVTIRENDDECAAEGIYQNFLMSTTTKMGKRMESNTIMFSAFCEREDLPDADRGYGIVTSEFVDVDERYPYHPTERVRKDVSGVIEVRAFNRNAGKSTDTESEGEDVIVVMTRWVQNTLHRPEFPMEAEGWRELRHSMDSWGLSLHRTLLESLHPQA